MHPTEFSAEPLPEPMIYRDVAPGEYASARFGPETTHIATFGLLACKAVCIYNSETRSGVLAHIDATIRVDRIVAPIINVYGGDLTNAEVSIVQASQVEETFMWPTVNMFANFFMAHDPRSLRIDRNVQNQTKRGVALCLRSGQIYSVSEDDEILRASSRNPELSIPIRGNNATWL